MRLLLLTLLFATSCTVGTLATPTPTPAPTATLWPTNTSSPTATATDAPTPTAEVMCAPNFWAYLVESTILWDDPQFKYAVGLAQMGITGRAWKMIVLDKDAAVLLLSDRTEAAWLVRVWDSPELIGWIPLHALPAECR